jgi:hypothetical protein
VATLRQEAEDTRVAMLAALQGDGHRIPPPPPVLALEALPSPRGTPRHSKTGGRASGQVLGASLEGIARWRCTWRKRRRRRPGCASASTARKRPRLRLLGRAGRGARAWRMAAPRPADADRAGPGNGLPRPARRRAGRGGLRRPLVGGPARAARPGRGARGAPGERALALRLWTAPFGRRFAVRRIGLGRGRAFLAGSPGAAPPDVPWASRSSSRRRSGGGAAAAGPAERVALGRGSAAPGGEMGGGERCLLVLPSIPVAGLDLLQAEVSAAMGDPALLEAALWLQPAGAAVASEADLSLSAPGARWSGWRRWRPGGAPLRLSLLLPPGAAPALAAVLELRNLGAEAEDLLRVEWSELTGARLREPVAAGSGAAAGPFHRARPPSGQPAAPARGRDPEGGADPLAGALRNRGRRLPPPRHPGGRDAGRRLHLAPLRFKLAAAATTRCWSSAPAPTGRPCSRRGRAGRWTSTAPSSCCPCRHRPRLPRPASAASATAGCCWR